MTARRLQFPISQLSAHLSGRKSRPACSVFLTGDAALELVERVLHNDHFCNGRCFIRVGLTVRKLLPAKREDAVKNQQMEASLTTSGLDDPVSGEDSADDQLEDRLLQPQPG